MKMVVAQMYNCIRMEFRKCFHSHNFIISMATCVLLALSSASYCCQGYLNIHDALDQYCFENGHMASTSSCGSVVLFMPDVPDCVITVDTVPCTMENTACMSSSP